MATYTSKLGLPLVAAGEANWDIFWRDQNEKLEARLTKQYAGNPQGNVVGDWAGQHCFDTTNKVLYVCTNPGSAAAATWVAADRLRVLPIANGGTGGNTVETARQNLGLTGDSVTSHYHDGRYYKKAEVYSRGEVDTRLATKVGPSDAMTPSSLAVGGGTSMSKIIVGKYTTPSVAWTYTQRESFSLNIPGVRSTSKAFVSINDNAYTWTCGVQTNQGNDYLVIWGLYHRINDSAPTGITRSITFDYLVII